MSTTISPASSAAPAEVDPTTLKNWLDAGRCVLVDVREEAERREEHIAGSVAMPLSRFDADALRARHPDAHFVFQCKAGKRSAKACSRLAQGGQTTQHLAGGIDAWIAAGLPTVKPANGPRLPIMRQVFLTAGLLVALGTLLGALVSPWLLVIPGFVGAGLVFSGVTGWCGMALLLGKMPWNR